MSRGKKAAQGLTPEEKLAQALVPMEEQPYQIPENWCWVRLENISKRISDGSHNPPKDAGNGIPILSATNIHDHFIDIDAATRWVTENQWKAENERTQIEPNDVLVTIVATIGRTAVVKEEIFALQRSVAVIKPKINSEFLSYFIETPYVQVYMNSNAKGTAQKGFYLSSLEQLYCVLPPLAEQQRIVDRIESIFSKLDEAKEKAQAVVDGFELRKSAILHKAFTGELTAKWREEHGVTLDRWTKSTFSDVVDEFKYGLSEKSDYGYDGIPVFRIPNVTDNGLSFDDLKYLSHSQIDSSSLLRKDDILIIRSNGSKELVGKSVLVPSQIGRAHV